MMHEHLVEAAMYDAEKATSMTEIQEAVSDIIGQDVGPSEEECKAAVERCLKSSRIVMSRGSIYELSAEVVKELEDRRKEFIEGENKFSGSLIESVGQAIGIVIEPIAEPLLTTAVRDTILEIFFNGALKLKRLLSKECDLSILIEEEEESENELRKRLEIFVRVQTGATIDDTVEGVKKCLRNVDGIERHFLGNLHRRVYFFQMINVDPRIKDIEQECLKNMRMYLDTNIAIRYLCDGTKLHSLVFEILEATKRVGVQLFVSPATLNELEYLVAEANKFSVYLKEGWIAKVVEAEPKAINNPVIEGFGELRRNNPRLNWEGYISPFKKLDEYLLSYEVVMERERSNDMEEDETYRDCYKEISLIKDEGTDIHILKHDASNFTLINRLRERYSGTPLGSAVWLLTIDRKLRILDRNLHRKYKHPHCQLLEQWGEILVNFEEVGKFLATDDYIAYLASQKLGALIPEETIDIHIFEAVANSEVMCDMILELDPEIAVNVIRDVQKDKEVRRLLEDTKGARPEEKYNIENKIGAKTDSWARKHKDEEVEKTNIEMERLRRGIRGLSEELRLGEFDREKNEKRIREIDEAVESLKKKLHVYESMSLRDRIKYVLGIRRWD